MSEDRSLGVHRPHGRDPRSRSAGIWTARMIDLQRALIGGPPANATPRAPLDVCTDALIELEQSGGGALATA
jgi:hypothetical protein